MNKRDIALWKLAQRLSTEPTPGPGLVALRKAVGTYKTPEEADEIKANDVKGWLKFFDHAPFMLVFVMVYTCTWAMTHPPVVSFDPLSWVTLAAEFVIVTTWIFWCFMGSLVILPGIFFGAAWIMAAYWWM